MLIFATSRPDFSSASLNMATPYFAVFGVEPGAITHPSAILAALRMTGSAHPTIHVGSGRDIGFGFISTGTSMG
jgi:hypothetical protein